MFRWCRCWWVMHPCRDAELPASLASMAFRQSIEVRPDPDFHNDATRLVSALRADHRSERATGGTAAPRTMQRSRPGRWCGVRSRAATLAAIALAIPALTHLRETPPPEMRLDSRHAGHGMPGSFALSPEGRQIVYVADSDGSPAPVAALAFRGDGTAPCMAREGARTPVLVARRPLDRVLRRRSPLKRLDLGGGQARRC